MNRLTVLLNHLRPATTTTIGTATRRILVPNTISANSFSSSSTSKRGSSSSLSDYPFSMQIQTRWKDNDNYLHVNNAEYLSYIDTVINTYLIRNCGLDVTKSAEIGLCIESHVKYFQPITFPDEITAAMRVASLGSSAVKYEVGIFNPGSSSPAAEGHFVHVFVNRDSRKKAHVPANIKEGLSKLLVEKKDHHNHQH